MWRVILLAVMVSSAAFGQTRPVEARLKPDAPEAARAYIDGARRERQQRIDEVTTAISEAEAQVKALRTSELSEGVSRQDRAKELRDGVQWIAKTKKDLAALKSDTRLPVPSADSVAEVRIGYVGVLGGRALQVVDVENVIISVAFYPAAKVAWRSFFQPSPGGVSQTDLWVSGVNTHGMVDGQPAPPLGVLEVHGTKQFDTAIGGSRTVLLARPFNINQWIESPATQPLP